MQPENRDAAQSVEPQTPSCRICGRAEELNSDDVCFDCWGSDDFWRQDVLAAIRNPDCTRDDVAVDYATALRAYGPNGEWREVNEAIIERWSASALVYIKEQAWKLAKP